MSDQPPAAAPSVDAHALMVTYSNYFRASGSAEELILNFVLDPLRHNPNDAPEPPVLRQRLVLTWGNAQRLARMLLDLLQRHEKRHGPLNPANPPPLT